ncbi:MAG: FkbM family methyltransferase [Chitinophagaceae bacterium]|nr:FkbM family methyltransferase [Chitinophagaceae bacterium]
MEHRLHITRIKIFFAKILYKIVTLFYQKEKQNIVRKGVRYQVDLSEGIELSLFLFGGFQKYITTNRYFKIQKDSIIFDIGANVGVMTLPFAQMVPNGSVYAFEPTFYALEKLKKNVSLNPNLSKNIHIFQCFLSEESKKNAHITAYSSWKINGKNNKENHTIHCGTAMNSENVYSITLDDFVKEHNIPRIDFIKIDTDGHEPMVLKGGKKTIQIFKPIIIFEVGMYVLKEKNIDFIFYVNYFDDLGYTLYDTKTEKKILASNYSKYIPQYGTTDIIAIIQK